MVNRPPVASCQNGYVLAGTGGTASASINNGSYDPDGNALTITQTPAGPYPLGATTVTLTVIDSWGAASQCTATVFDYSVQDNTSGDYLLFNSQSGAYYFRRCATGLTITGTGQVSSAGCTVRLTANNTNRVTVSVNKCLATATATVTTMSPVATYTLTDSNISNNTNTCPGS